MAGRVLGRQLVGGVDTKNMILGRIAYCVKGRVAINIKWQVAGGVVWEKQAECRQLWRAGEGSSEIKEESLKASKEINIYQFLCRKTMTPSR